MTARFVHTFPCGGKSPRVSSDRSSQFEQYFSFAGPSVTPLGYRPVRLEQLDHTLGLNQ
jgi:hypothetical protein